jgi:hypothetical protein
MRLWPEVGFGSIAISLLQARFWSAYLSTCVRDLAWRCPRLGIISYVRQEVSTGQESCEFSTRVIEILDCQAVCI